jgi:hypothetical protein
LWDGVGLVVRFGCSSNIRFGCRMV